MSVSLHPLSHRKQLEMMNRDVAQLVSAPALGAGGPPFESEYPDKSGKEPERNFRFFFYIQKCLSGRLPRSNGHFAVQRKPGIQKGSGLSLLFVGKKITSTVSTGFSCLPSRQLSCKVLQLEFSPAAWCRGRVG